MSDIAPEAVASVPSARGRGAVDEIGPDVPVLSLRNVHKTFVGTRALKGVDLDIKPGEVHALVGANGSGKSTLIKVLAGYHSPDPGATALFNDEEIKLGHRDRDGSHQMRFVHQDLGLLLQMSALENLAFTAGFSTGVGGRVRWREQERRTTELLDRLDVHLDVNRPLIESSPVERTIVAIAAALSGWENGRGLLVLDEPTAVLPHTEVGRLLDIVRGVQAMGASILYVSHRLDEVFAIADRVTVLRDGRVTATREADELDAQSLAELMVGDHVDARFRLGRPPTSEADATVLEVKELSSGTLDSLSFSVARGEILGIAGFLGSGAETVPYVLAGVKNAESGEVRRDEAWQHAADAFRCAGFPLVPADRAGEAVVGPFSVAENLTLRVLNKFDTRAAWTSKREERRFVDDWIDQLQIKVSSRDDAITSLSGGNQQKVIMGRCLASAPDLLILAEPTAGVDVGTRQAIYELIGKLADDGLAVVVTSTDTTDLLALCSRVLVLADGRQSAELVGEAITEGTLLEAMEAGNR